MIKNQKHEVLVQGIETLLSTNRCPLTDDDKVLLQNCLTELKEKNSLPDLASLEKVARWLLLFFEVAQAAKDFF